MLEPQPEEKHKAVTRFICQELLYEFVLGRLDPERQKAMDLYLSSDRDSQHELERLRRGFVFASQMSKSQMSGALRAALLGFEPVWKRRLTQWTTWFSRRGWKLLPYLVLAGILVLGVAVIKPWTYFTQHEVILVEDDKAPGTPAALPADVAAKVQTTNKDTPLVPPVTPQPAVKKAERPSLETPPENEISLPSPLPLPTPIVKAVDLSASVEPTAATTATAESPEKTPKSVEHFWSYRGRLELGGDYEIAVAAIREKINSLEGQVVGTIGLGVQRKQGEAYFNFSLPESKQQDFEDFLKNFSRVQFRKHSDKQGMPEGQNHIILTVKDVSPHEDGKAPETP